jgi:type IV secretion system protein VirB8
MNFLGFFKKKDNSENFLDSSFNTKDWYRTRYENIIVQRNILFGFVLLCMIIVGISVIAIYKLSELKQFDPYVIQIDDDTGNTRLVTKFSQDTMVGNEEIAKYFIKKYLVARETYNAVDFDTAARKTIRLMSRNEIYYQYMGYIKNPKNDPTILYGNRNNTYLNIKSWSKIDPKKYIVRFSVTESSEELKSKDKIAIVQFDYFDMQLSESDREINPIGIQITGYRVDDDNS